MLTLIRHDFFLQPFDDDNWEMAKILMPTAGQDTNPSAGGSHNGGGGMSLDLNTLLRALDQHTKDKQVEQLNIPDMNS